MDKRQACTVRPLQYSDIAVIENRARWGQPRVTIAPHHKGIGAIAADGTFVGYCGFSGTPRGAEAQISAVQSCMPGAGTALINALKARFYRLIAEDVLLSAAVWWKRQGFMLLHPATEDDEEGVRGSYEWWRDDDPVFAVAPYESVWPNHRSLAQLICDEQKRQQAVAPYGHHANATK
jgi:hypothetical protein